MRTQAHHRPALDPRQLLALARDALKREPTTDVADLAEALKVRIARGGWAYPRPDQLTEALTHVLRDQPVSAPPAPPPAPAPPPPLSKAEAQAALAALLARFPQPTRRPSTDRLMTTRERYALVAKIEALREAQRDVHRARRAEAEGVDEGVRPEGVDPTSGHAR